MRFAVLVCNCNKDVVEKKKRPDITQVKHKQLAIIIQDCWDHDPDNRPTFEGLISNNTIQIARADIFLSEFPDAHKLWLDNWNTFWVLKLRSSSKLYFKVPFDHFCSALEQFLFVKISARQEEILRRILFPKTTDVGEEEQLTIGNTLSQSFLTVQNYSKKFYSGLASFSKAGQQ